MVIDQQPGEECICVGPWNESENDEWEIWHGELDEYGKAVATEPILRLPHEREVVVLAKNIGDGLEVPVYRMIPSHDAELIQSPLGA